MEEMYGRLVRYFWREKKKTSDAFVERKKALNHIWLDHHQSFIKRKRSK